METIARNVRDLAAVDRTAVERLLGHSLLENQQLIIQVVSVEVATPSTDVARPAQSIEDWTGVYEGLSDEQIEAIDKAAKTRANLTRNLP